MRGEIEKFKQNGGKIIKRQVENALEGVYSQSGIGAGP